MASETNGINLRQTCLR